MLEPTELTQAQIDRLAGSDLTFSQIAEKYSEDTAINVGIAHDPDTFELDDAWFARARPAIEVHPHLVAQSLRRRRKQEGLDKWEVNVSFDTDVLAHFLESGPDWQKRINDTLRSAIEASPQSPPLRPE